MFTEFIPQSKSISAVIIMTDFNLGYNGAEFEVYVHAIKEHLLYGKVCVIFQYLKIKHNVKIAVLYSI